MPAGFDASIIYFSRILPWDTYYYFLSRAILSLLSYMLSIISPEGILVAIGHSLTCHFATTTAQDYCRMKMLSIAFHAHSRILCSRFRSTFLSAQLEVGLAIRALPSESGQPPTMLLESSGHH